MSILLSGWAGDHAGSVMGRQPYTALVSVSSTDDSAYFAFFQKADIEGTSWYNHIYATCLTPGAASAWVTGCTPIGDGLFSLELSYWSFGSSSGEPWKPGVHLFSIDVQGNDWSSNWDFSRSTTIVTVVVPPKIKKGIALSDSSVQKMLTTSQRQTRRRIFP
jgi:hypothetical protein